MLIRSQDKKKLANLNTAQGIAITGEYAIEIWYDGRIKIILGEYTTQAKAIKILSMIHSSSCAMELSAFNFDKETRKYCLEMPQDSEVLDGD